MTVIVGVLCSDGVVVGSDSSVTFTGGSIKTIEQLSKKTFKVGDDLIFSFTGAGGQGQRFDDVVSRLKVDKPLAKLKALDVGREIARVSTQDFGYTGANRGTFGALAGFSCANGFHLCEFAESDFQPELKTREMWFCSMGSGQPITDPFLALARRTLFRDAQPKLNEGVFLAYWTLGHAIELNTGGIQGPVQIATLSKDANGKPRSRLLAEADFGEHEGMVQGIEEHLRLYREKLAGNVPAKSTPAQAPPIPPQQKPP